VKEAELQVLLYGIVTCDATMRLIQVYTDTRVLYAV